MANLVTITATAGDYVLVADLDELDEFHISRKIATEGQTPGTEVAFRTLEEGCSLNLHFRAGSAVRWVKAPWAKAT